jgi:hypothetical protein
MTLDRGTLLNSRYRIIDILGQGGMGAVYRALDENIEVEVAVKENLYLSPEYTRQFRREAVILASLHHPSLPRVSDYFLIAGQGQYMIMDYIEGEDLRQRMERMGRIPEQDVILIGAAMCNALTYLHTRQPPIIHRDIKPGNVKITPKGQVALVDFGLAKLMVDQQATTTGARAMTPGFSPPEQYGTGRTDPRTDIYSLAATLYAALTGVIPEDGLARATGNADLTPIRELNPEVSRRTAAVIETALAIDPDERYQNAEEFKCELLEASGNLALLEGDDILLSPAPVEAVPTDAIVVVPEAGVVQQPPSRPNRLRRRTRPKRVSANWMALIIILIMGSGLFYAVGPGHLPASLSTWLTGGRVSPTPTLLFPANTHAITFPTATVFQGAITPDLGTAIPPTASYPVPVQASTTALPTPTVTPIGGGLGQIAFVSTRSGGLPQIWVMDPNGNRQVQVTNVPDGACQPSWAPDGQAFVFTSPCYGPAGKYPGSSLFIWRKDGSVTPIPPSPEGDYDPAWSPDGKRIAFTSLRDGHPQIYIYNVLDQSFKNISNSISPDHQPAWNGAGSLIAFIRTQVSEQVWYMTDAGTHQDQYSISGEFNDLYPLWSPDGQVLFYNQTTHNGDVPWLEALRYKDRGSALEFRIPAKGQTDPGPVRHPSVSPDGFWIVFEGWPQGDNHDIYRMSVNGSNFQRLTSDRDLDFDPAWGPGSLFP